MQTFWYRRLLIKDSAALLQVEKEVEGKVKVSWGSGLPLRRLIGSCVPAWPLQGQGQHSSALSEPALLDACSAAPCTLQYDTANHSWKKLQMLVQQLRKCCNHPVRAWAWCRCRHLHVNASRSDGVVLMSWRFAAKSAA